MQEYGKINSILRKNKKCTIEEIAKINNKGIYKTRQDIINYLYKEVEQIEPNININKCKHLYKAFKYLDNLDNEKDKEQVLNGLIKLQKLCKNRIKQNNIEAENIYDKLLSIIKVTLFNLSCNNIDNIHLEKAKLLKYIIFEMKNLNYLFELLKTYPNYITIKDENGYVIERVIEEYANLLNESEYNLDLIYLEKVIKIFADSPKFIENNDLKIKLLNNIKNNIKNNQKSTFFMNEIIGDIKNTDINQKDYSDLVFKYDINLDFTDENSCEKIKIDLDSNDLIDLRHLNTITIDGKGTRVYDDACSLQKMEDGNYLLSVFVADVASYVHQDSLIDKIAYERSETLYLPQQVITMLPLDLTESLTLKEKQDKTAIGHFFVLNEKMEVLDFRINRCLINIDKNYSYESVVKSLNNSNNVEELEMLLLMAEVAIKLHQNASDRQEYRAIKQLKKKINGNECYDPSIGTLMIMEFMTLTNATLADYFYNKTNAPFIYRNNTKYGEDIRENINNLSPVEDKETMRAIYNQLGTMSFYSPFNLGHKGLKLRAYCHATNPLRNYASLKCQRLIINNIIHDNSNQNYDNDLEEIIKLCEYMNKRLSLNKTFADECLELKKHK